MTLRPPFRWTAKAIGNYRTWELEYRVRPTENDTTEFTMQGHRTPVLLGERNPSQRSMRRELLEMWRNYGKAMESDYRRTRAVRRS